MGSASLEAIQRELHNLRRDIAFVKHALMEDYRLSAWSKKELAKARKISDSKLLSHESVKRKILAK
jgi:hypothetical protein